MRQSPVCLCFPFIQAIEAIVGIPIGHESRGGSRLLKRSPCLPSLKAP